MLNQITRLFLISGLAIAAVSPAALAQRGNHPPPPGAAPSIVFYSETNLRGQAVEVTNEVIDFSRIQFNDKARSVEVRGGVWQICSDGNFRGRCEYVDRTVRNLGELNLSGNISSAKPVPGGQSPRNFDIVFFRDGNFSGPFVGFNQGEADLNSVRFNDTASSIQINRGTWLVCEHADYRGQCEFLDRSVSELGSLGLNDKITSFRKYDVRREGQWRRPVTPVPTRPGRDTRGGFEGEQSVFFPAPAEYGRRISNSTGAATRFCQSMGFREAAYKASGPVLSDVVCR